MRECNVSDLVKDVKVILDRNQESASLVPIDTDTLSQSALIESKIEDAAKIIEEQAPAHRLGDVESTDKGVVWTMDNGASVGEFLVGSSILRIVKVVGSDWIGDAMLITSDDMEYRWQKNKYVRGNSTRPVAALTHRRGQRVLELYSSDSGKTVVEVHYVPTPRIGNGKISLCEPLMKAVEYMAGSLVSVSMGDANMASSLRELAYAESGIEVGNGQQQ